MVYVCGCDVGSTYGKAAIMDLAGNLVGTSIVRSKIDPELTSELAIEEAMKDIEGLEQRSDFAYVVGTGYGRNRVPFADENVSEISCHAMGVHMTDPRIRTIIDIGGQDLKGIQIDEDGSVKHFAMNDKCAAGTGRFFENIAQVFELSLSDFCALSLKSENPVPITSQCTVFAESEVITLVGQKKDPADIAAGIQVSVAKRCYTMLKSAGNTREIAMTGGCAKNEGLKREIEKLLGFNLVMLTIDPQLMGAIGASEFARKKALVQ